MRRSTIFWIVAALITFASAYYQRRTGPTYPVKGVAFIDAKRIAYRLERTHGGQSNYKVQISTGDSTISGIVEWKHHGVNEPLMRMPMVFAGDALSAELPLQPPSGKLEYRILLKTGSESAVLPEAGPVVIRFRGDVPNFILIPHILAMFSAMLLSTRAGLEVFSPKPRLPALILLTLGFLILGGMILGPIMQKYSFGAYWTGWPLGTDLTDNKTVVALFGWFAAAIALRTAKNPRLFVAAAAALLLAVYMIPHSVLGSELKYDGPNQRQVPCAADPLPE